VKEIGHKRPTWESQAHNSDHPWQEPRRKAGSVDLDGLDHFEPSSGAKIRNVSDVLFLNLLEEEMLCVGSDPPV
jgi:hypothetical protein